LLRIRQKPATDVYGLTLREVAEILQAECEKKPDTGRDQGGVGQGDEWVWAPDGNSCQVAGLGERGHLAGLKGLATIQRLVQAPGQPVLMIMLVGGAAKEPDKDKRSKQPAMDAEALRAAYTQFAALRSEIEQAEAEGRTMEAAESRAELERLQGVMQTALGVRGRVRDLNDLANKLRPTIHAQLTRVYRAMREATPPMPELATHLESAISSEGAAFVYRPAVAATWKTNLPPQL
jgi:hypothetical protein